MGQNQTKAYSPTDCEYGVRNFLKGRGIVTKDAQDRAILNYSTHENVKGTTLQEICINIQSSFSMFKQFHYQQKRKKRTNHRNG